MFASYYTFIFVVAYVDLMNYPLEKGTYMHNSVMQLNLSRHLCQFCIMVSNKLQIWSYFMALSKYLREVLYDASAPNIDPVLHSSNKQT